MSNYVKIKNVHINTRHIKGGIAMCEINLTLARLKVVVSDLGDDWFKVCIYFTDFDDLSPEELVDLGHGFKLHKDCLTVPLLTLYNTKDELIEGDKYERLIANTEKYVSNSPLNDFILESITAVRDAIIWLDMWKIPTDI